MAQSQSQAIRTFVLGNKELEGKTAEFQYDHGWYSICDIMDEQRNVVYKSKNAQEAYAKWNVYIGRKKERPERKDDRPNAKQGRNHREEQGRTHAKDMSDNRGEHKDYNHQKPRRQNRNRRNQNHS